MIKYFVQVLSVFFTVVCFFVSGYSQQQPAFPNSHLSRFLLDTPGELVYMHTDRDLYAQNDTLWFKIYLLDEHNHKPQMGLRNVYVELIDSSGTPFVRNLIQINNGAGNGELIFSDYKIDEGTFVIRAYTNYQQNFGDEFIFTKHIKVENISSNRALIVGSSNKAATISNLNSTPIIDLQFLPEGGYLTSNLPNQLAFKAIRSDGQSVDVSGDIYNETDQVVAHFQSSYGGMGKLRFFPEADKTYTAKIEGRPEVAYKIPKSGDKIQFSVDTKNDSSILIKLVRNSYQNYPTKYYLVNTVNGKILFYLPIEMEKSNVHFMLKRSQFGLGINKLTLSDKDRHPLAERLIFIKKDNLLTISVEVDKNKYRKREKVNVGISTFIGSDSVAANLSVSVLNQKQAILLEKYPQNILSYLLLDSELKGNIENPSYYFRNDSAKTTGDLDLLMLTQGWRSYNWDIFLPNVPSAEYIKDSGLVVSGRLKRLLGKKGAENGKLTMLMRGKTGGVLLSETVSDSTGMFKFPPSVFPDSVSVFIQGLNKKNKRYTELLDLETFSTPAPLDVAKLCFPSYESIGKSDFIRKAYARLADDKEFHPEKYNILLDEIVINKKLNHKDQEDDGHFRMYGMADDVLVVDETASGFSNIWMYMVGRVAGVNISGNAVSIRGGASFAEGGNTPLFLLDGVPVEKEMLDGISLSEVDKIEVLKNVSSLALFGSQGANGVISVFTKRGDMSVREEYYSGIVSDKLRGYSVARNFYSPNYNVETTEKPDHRATLYWNPNVNTGSSGKSNFSFFTSDDTDPVLIKVEGISGDGKPGVGFVKLLMRGSFDE